MNILVLRGFNNYFNRLVKKYLTLDEYRNKSKNTIDWQQVNFNPNDGLMTELIVGGPTQLNSYGEPLDWGISGNPDYLVVYDEMTNAIVSRWFVIQSERTRNGQYKLVLKRDVLADNIEEFIASPIFVEKGIINNIDNPLLFNNENMTYNQIKEKEYLLKDPTGVPWIVGYIAKNYPETKTKVDGQISNILTDALTPEELPFKFSLGEDVLINGGVDLKIDLSAATYTQTYVSAREVLTSYKGYKMEYMYNDAYSEMKYNPDGSSIYPYNYSTYGFKNEYVYSLYSTSSPEGLKNEITTKMSDISGELKVMLQEKIRSDFAESVDSLEKYRGKIVYDSDSAKYYRISFETQVGSEQWENYDVGNEIITAISDYAKPYNVPAINKDLISVSYRSAVVKPVYTEITSQSISITIEQGGPAATRGIVNNSVFDIFALPYGEIGITTPSGTKFTTSAEASISIGRSIATTLTDSAVYDLQLLPYCPIKEIRDYYETNGYIELKAFDQKYWALGNKGDSSAEDPITVLFWATSASGTLNIPLSIDVPTTPLELKVHNETTVCRLCSPNYAGMFEFSLAKNRGIDYVNVDYNYRPYSPYIHVNPNFKGLYGKDWNDSRGLICGGDFTVSSLSSAWQNYQVQNKNYQVIFDRQIQNMDVNNSIALEQQTFNAVAGTITGGITGAVGGAIGGAKLGAPGAYAIAGGIAGAGLSAIGGALDRDWLLRQQNEARSYAIDSFGYQLGNIQALPYSLSRTDSLNENNKIWPFLEIYTCTEKEKKALRDKIKYNGMTVMAVEQFIDTFDFSSSEKTYLKGQLIRSDEFEDDSNILNEIYSELNKGVYLIGAEINLEGGNNASTERN